MSNGFGHKWVRNGLTIAVVWGFGGDARADTVRLWKEAVAMGDDVRLADVCQLSGIDRDAALKYGELVVADAPVVGGSVIVSIGDVRRALSKGGANLAVLVLKGAAACHVTRPKNVARPPAKLRESSSDRHAAKNVGVRGTLRDAIEVFLNGESGLTVGHVDVQYGRVSDSVLNLREPEFQFEIRRTSGSRLGLVGLEVTVLSQGKRAQSLPLFVNVSIVKPVVVTAHAINLDATISASDVHLIDMTFTRFEQMGIDEPAEAIGQRAKRFIAAGQVVKRRDLEPVPLVKRGQIVDVYSHVGGVTVVSAAKALSSGIYGGIVQLRADNHSTKRFTATVTGPGRVSMGFTDPSRSVKQTHLAMGGER